MDHFSNRFHNPIPWISLSTEQLTSSDYWHRSCLGYRCEVVEKMIDAFIIEKLKKEKERREQSQWQPIPLPLEKNVGEDEAKKKKQEKKGAAVIQF